MNFTSQEIGALKKLQKTERQFQKMKWVLLILCIASIVATGYMMRIVASIPERFAENLEFQAILYAKALPAMYLSSIVTGGIIGFTMKNWRGNPERTLILGLAERLNQSNSNPAGAGQPGNPPA